MTIYKDVNGREFTYNEYWNKIYLDEKRPHVDHLIRHKWPEEKPGDEKSYWARVEINGVVSFAEMYWSQQLGWHTQHGKHITHWWNLPEVKE